MKRIDFDELDTEYDDAGGITYILDGKPFTGIAYKKNRQGQLMRETSFVDGMEDGESKVWYQNGYLKSSATLKLCRSHGKFQQFYETGQLKCEGIAEFGYVLKRKKWDEDNTLSEDYKIEDDPEKYSLWQAVRLQFLKKDLH